MRRYDLIVVGAGIVGAACAAEAAGEGLSVALVEPGPIGGGATAAAMGHLVAMDDDPAELALSAYSLRLWERYAQLEEAEFSRCGTLWVARNPRELATVPAKIDRLAQAGLRAEQLDATQLYRFEPALIEGLAGGMRVPGEAVVYPPRMARRLVDQAVQAGACLYAGRRVTALVPGGVRLDDGEDLSGTVLVATGVALPQLLPELPMRPRKGQLAITDRYPGLVHHQLLSLDYADSAHGDADTSVAFNVQPRPTGQLLIGSSRQFNVADRQVDWPLLRKMLRQASAFLPVLRELQVIRVWTGLRPATPDGRPYLGPVPGRREVWVAAGHEGLGVTTALGTARLVVDGLLGRAPEIDPAPYLPDRAITGKAA
ncbi:FAD-binding oxidoreductase [Pseudoxanthomonas winnipegensis]|jgi:glycine/D-amino acid oxidase-like deaminating enzyme|uniref:FAD-binding oxidoreductase n=1 Tax=Pseudoxanthomonas winnipegensis TaxID=2480810 RepID=A0ABY1WF77_9GAMM|nr:FAD-dependent oxidoreductase [Pseudoxanthomonas winnipegensis]TAA08884.1 FAD-binding oxidoreductase [Pseudoxanthomonas winnipegensis]TAA20583.1 FAD-binding oxidoreductase [Pseudoxanthomonas winnipegensis]TAH71763.1 FAD-binding oxidoreductase [Pseudoxanthomonas winnipegensis]